MKHYTIVAEVPVGKGDYGSDSLTVLDEKVHSERIAINVAQRLATERRTRTMVFVGKDRGLGELGERLTDAAHVYGEVCLYVGDDGLVYQE